MARKSTTRRSKTTSSDEVSSFSRAKRIWVALIFSLAATTGVMLLLDPTAKPGTPTVLMERTSRQTLTDTKAPAGAWNRIVLIDTNSPFANGSTLHKQAVELGEPKGVGFHFVVGNGKGLDDGRPYACKFWDEQLPASSIYGRDVADGRTIVIAVAGNTDRDRVTTAQSERVRTLVLDLMRKYGIRPESVDASRVGPGFASAELLESIGG